MIIAIIIFIIVVYFIGYIMGYSIRMDDERKENDRSLGTVSKRNKL